MKLHRSEGAPDFKNIITVSGGPNNHYNIRYLSTGTKTMGQHLESAANSINLIFSKVR